MIRVLNVFGSLNRGGSETMVMNLYRNIDRDRIQFDFIIHQDSENGYEREIEKMGGRIYRVPKYRIFNHFSYINSWKKLLKQHPEWKVIHGHMFTIASIYLKVAKKENRVTIAHSHSTSSGKGLKSIFKFFLRKPLANIADYLLACSNDAGEWLYGYEKTKGNNYYVVKNSIDVDSFKYNEILRKKYRNQLDLNNSTVYGHVGSISKPKNHIFLLKLFKELLKVEPNSILIIVGDGKLKDDISREINLLDIEKNVKMLGSRDDIAGLLQAMDMFLFPSIWEGLPVAVVEAQASGLPCFISENITKEVRFIPTLKYLPIDKGVRIWVDTILKTDLTRDLKAYDIIRDAGFDVNYTANWMMDFYERIIL